MKSNDIITLYTMSEQEQEKIIKQLREQVVEINTQKPSKPADAAEKEILEKAKEAGDTIDDDTISAEPSNRA